MSNWILGKTIDSTKEYEISTSENFLGYLVQLEHPRCLIAVGNKKMVNEGHLFSVSPDAGFFFCNESKDFSLIILEWLDQENIESDLAAKLLYSAASHFSIKLEEDAENAAMELQSVT